MFKRVTRNPRDVVIDYMSAGDQKEGAEMVPMPQDPRSNKKTTTSKRRSEITFIGFLIAGIRDAFSSGRRIAGAIICLGIWVMSFLFISRAIWPSAIPSILPIYLLAAGALLLVLKGTVGVLHNPVPNKDGIIIKTPWLEKYSTFEVLPNSTFGIDILGIALIVTYICRWGGEYIEAFLDTIMILIQILRLMACLARPFIEFLDAILKIPLIGSSLNSLDRLLEVADNLATDACPIS